MNQTKLCRTIREWAGYLESKGYVVAIALRGGLAAPFDLLTISPRHEVVLWKVVMSRRSPKCFSKPEIMAVRQQMALASTHHAKAYIAIRFEKPRGRMATIPAELVFAEKQIGTDLGGIDWPPKALAG